MNKNRIEELRRNHILKKHGKCPGPDIFASEDDALKESTFPDEDEIIRMMEDEHGVPSRWIELLVGERAANPSHPAIPDDVRETLMELIDESEGIDACFEDGEAKRANLAKTEAARAWIAQCPTATDKAVCPECGKDWPVWSGKKRMTCPNLMCAHEFDIKLIVISPPRAPKVTP